MTPREIIVATKKQIDKRITELQKYDKAYYTTTKPLISDEKYDGLRKELQNWDPNNEYFDAVGSVVLDGEKYTHVEPMQSSCKLSWIESSKRPMKSVLRRSLLK